MLLNGMQIPTKAISSYLSSNLQTDAAYSCSEFCQVLLTLVEKVIVPQDQDHIHKLFLYQEYAKACFRPPKYSTPTLGVDKKHVLE